MPDTIAIKGISQGILVTLPDGGSWSEFYPQLVELIAQRAAFFKGAQLVLDTREYPVSTEALTQLKSTLETQTINLVGILSQAEKTLSAAASLGLATDLAQIQPPTKPRRDPPPPTYEDAEIDSEEYGTHGVLIKRTLRSGRTVRSNGHVVVIGDVNSGAEIIAVGDIVVWGKLRGRVHAGAQGDESALVCALDLLPVQLRIAGLITIPPQETRRHTQPEMACIQNGQIEAKPWLT